MAKNLNTKSKNIDLLNNKEFISHLIFEVNYSSIAKGGHAPYYFPIEKQKRLVNDVNIFTSAEQKEIAYNLLNNNNN